MSSNKKKSTNENIFIDYDTPEDLLLDLPPEEIDRLYEETFGKGKSNSKDKSDAENSDDV